MSKSKKNKEQRGKSAAYNLGLLQSKTDRLQSMPQEGGLSVDIDPQIFEEAHSLLNAAWSFFRKGKPRKVLEFTTKGLQLLRSE